MTTVARANSVRGEVVLRRRDNDGALELRVNGVFVMDDHETSTERRLARLSLDAVSAPPGRQLSVLVAGLGLGFTLAELLSEDRVGRALVVELEPALLQWHRDGLVPDTASLLADPRVELVADDIADVVPALPAGSFDVLLLDVDNGPDFLVYASNADLYRPAFLIGCRRALRPGGVLAVWSSTDADRLAESLDTAFGGHGEIDLAVTVGTRPSSYRILLATREEDPMPDLPE